MAGTVAHIDLRQKLHNGLLKYIPISTVDWAVDFLLAHKVHLVISKKRLTKLGDYRHPYGKYGHRISVNYDLNEYAFLVTLVHEFSHLIAWNQYKRSILPHGKEWKQCYQELMNPLIEARVFPADVSLALSQYMNQPKASSCTDVHLSRVLASYDNKANETLMHLEILPYSSMFATANGRQFIKGHKRRTRFICEEIPTGKKFLFHPLCPVKPTEA